MNKKKILIFTGAGISRESGIRTFRDSTDGMWEEFKVEEVASAEGWRKDKVKVLDFYNRRRKELESVSPNKAHKIVADLEKYFEVIVVTQNVDDLHERAGSTDIIHLHGELTKARGSLYSNKVSPLDTVIDIGYKPINIGDVCSVTGAQLRPHIIWFQELLDATDLEMATEAAKEADVCIIIGTSMQVTPASTIPFLTKETAIIYYVDPGDIDFDIPDDRDFRHINESATTGMEKVYKELTNGNL
jgi:NAD-dependent deacetylase